MARALSRLVGPALVATGPTTVLTAGATEQIDIRKVRVTNPTASAVSFTMSIGADAAATRIIGPSAPTIAANSSQDFWFGGEATMQPAEILTVSAGTNNVLVLAVGGYRNTLG